MLKSRLFSQFPRTRVPLEGGSLLFQLYLTCCHYECECDVTIYLYLIPSQAYERTFAVANNKTTAGAPIHINIGDAGNREGPCPDYYPQPEWSAFRESKFGHGEMYGEDALSYLF